MEESGKRSARTGRKTLGLGLAAALLLLAFTPSFALAVCGDTVVDAGEDCDDGNGTGGDCCSAACAYETGGSACADDGSVCTVDLCDGEGTCLHEPGNAGTECRPDGRIVGLGAVDAGVLRFPVAIAETWFETHQCGGGDVLQLYPFGGTSCSAWHTYNTTPGSAANLKSKVQGIHNGTYTPPAATAGSTTFNLVGGTVSSALADIVTLYNANKNPSGEWTVRVPVFASDVCANFTSTLQITGFATVTIYACSTQLIQAYVDCVTLASGSEGLADYGTVVGGDTECGLAESCDGVSPTCPADVHEPYGTACDADSLVCTADVCDGAGVCTHVGGNVGATCRASAGACDPAETCSGGIACPADAKSTAVCRAAGGACDVAETCDGVANACPSDAKSTAVCRGVAGTCDVAETCDGIANACPADAVLAAANTCRETGGVCDVAETCDGVAAACPADAKLTSACRSSAGVCDAAESCNGVDSDCPVDSHHEAGTACRASAGVCDVAETCTGASAQCPSDAFASGTTCRNAAGVCDVAETCSGASAACPADAFDVGAACRASAGECDAAESCVAAAACPPDLNAPFGTPCGDPAATSCSAPDSCDDLGVCDENNLLPGTPCEDDYPCTTYDLCDTDGNCHAGPFPACDDGNACTVDECAPETGDCSFETRPATGCRSAGKSSFGVSTGGDGKARWKWGKGEATSCEDFGAPDADTGYDVCVFDGAGDGTYDLAAHFALPANGLWERSSACRWTYRDRAGLIDGITGVKLTPRDSGRASIQISAEGELAPLPVPVASDRYMNADPDVTVQIVNSAGVCWESRLTESRKNTGDAYKGTGAVEIGGTEAP
jgi:cysteine-rich repeat protein